MSRNLENEIINNIFLVHLYL